MFFYRSGIVNPAERRSDILRRCLFLRRAYLFAWGCVSWQGWPLGSLETDRRAVRSWAGWEWAGLVGREQQQVARPTIDSGNSQAHGLNHVLALWGLILLWKKRAIRWWSKEGICEPHSYTGLAYVPQTWKKRLAWTTFERNADIWETTRDHWRLKNTEVHSQSQQMAFTRSPSIITETTRFTMNFRCILNLESLILQSTLITDINICRLFL